MKPSLYIMEAKTTHCIRKSKTWNQKTKKWKASKPPILEKKESVPIRHCDDLWDLIAKVRQEAQEIHDLDPDEHFLEVTFKLGVCY